MFTGIIEEVGRVASAQSNSLTISASQALCGMEAGGSIAVNGVCLTITSFNTGSLSVDIMPETLMRTNLGLLCVGDEVNLERPLALGGYLGGHLVQGHVDDTGRVTAINREGGAMLIRFEAPPQVMSYMVEKGFIAVDGISLTVVSIDNGSFEVSVVDYTLKNTTLGGRRVGNLVNLEADIIAKYVVQLNKKEKTDITFDFLKEHGFLAG